MPIGSITKEKQYLKKDFTFVVTDKIHTFFQHFIQTWSRTQCGSKASSSRVLQLILFYDFSYYFSCPFLQKGLTNSSQKYMIGTKCICLSTKWRNSVVPSCISSKIQLLTLSMAENACSFYRAAHTRAAPLSAAIPTEPSTARL